MLRHFFVILMVAGAALTVAAWAVSSEMAENQALAHSPTRESLLDARALLWVLRIGSPVVAIGCWISLRRWPPTQAFLLAAGREFAATTRLAGSASPGARVRSGAMRAVLVAWLLLAGVHWTDAARRALHEWPVYRFDSGADVLPNMSESNRVVIRYLQTTTPEDARILVASDQTLFFLAYELWPRKVFQRRHPDSEFTIPQPGQARQLAAYRLSDLAAEDIAALRPDYVLEYFEGPEYVEPDRLMDDALWVEFARQLYNDRTYIAPYNVRLQPYSEFGSRQ